MSQISSYKNCCKNLNPHLMSNKITLIEFVFEKFDFKEIK